MNQIFLTITTLLAGFAGPGRAETALSAAPFPLTYAAASGPDSELIQRYVIAMRIQSVIRRGIDTEVVIQARLPTLNREATLRALRCVTASGKITYETLDAAGDGMVRREVIARYLTAESEASQTDEIAITPSHYKIIFTRAKEETGRPIRVFQLTPKRRRPGLFKGELWLDSQTGLPVRISGEFVKNPSAPALSRCVA